MSFKFEKLEVWKKSLELSIDADKLSKTFPKEELYILTSQMKRAADSVVLNIAEGSTGQTNAEFKQFLGYAIRSAIEVVACLHIGKERKLLKKMNLLNYTQSLKFLSVCFNHYEKN